MTGSLERKYFIVTVDAEGDDQWNPREAAQTLNAAYLPRFQALCEKFCFKPVYLTTYEMAHNPAFTEFMQDRLAEGFCEVGMHLHAWGTPPFHALQHVTDQHPYLIEYPYEVMDEKIHAVTSLLEETFARRIVSHRAGRWAIDGRYLELLEKHGYGVDCSVTPHVDWSGNPGQTGIGGADYSHFPESPYLIRGSILEMPVTIRRTRRGPPGDVRNKVKSALFGRTVWMRPSVQCLDDLVHLAQSVANEPNTDYLQFMIHSSELMPGGSCYYASEASVEQLYDSLECLFTVVRQRFTGITLAGYRDLKLPGCHGGELYESAQGSAAEAQAARPHPVCEGLGSLHRNGLQAH